MFKAAESHHSLSFVPASDHWGGIQDQKNCRYRLETKVIQDPQQTGLVFDILQNRVV
jgi:hypothetical protein